MAEEKYTFTHQEVVEALIQKQGLREGIWALYVEFGINATNVQTPDQNILPSAIVPIVRMGLQKADAVSPIAVDAGQMRRSSEPTTARRPLAGHDPAKGR